MLRIAVRSLIHDRSRLLAALAGVAFAGLLTAVQSGLYEGFLYTTSSIVTRMGGDVWVTAKGVRVIDNMEPLSAGTRSTVLQHSCTVRARPLVLAFSWVRTREGSRENVRIVGTENGEPYMPWELARGLPTDLAAPMRVAVDELDLKRLGIHDGPIGDSLAIMNKRAYIGAVSRRARSFTLLPFIFASVDDARRMTQFSDGEVSAWVVDLRDPACASDVVRMIERNPELRAWRADELRVETQRFWMESSGAGAILGFSALMGLLVGGVIVGQTLYSAVRDHEPELATLRAIGASPWRVARFVGWQALFLTVVGGAAGIVAALGLGVLAARGGMEMIFSPAVILKSVLVLIGMASFASALSVRRVLAMEPAKVFR
ncbi:MAG TPA: ABC transporter permease [Labilithrix sp.]|nr:ABC transporter permease [Labilithrix sp.]